MKNKLGFCKFCQKEMDFRCIVTSEIGDKVYFVANCDVCNRGNLDCFKTTRTLFDSKSVKLEHCQIV